MIFLTGFNTRLKENIRQEHNIGCTIQSVLLQAHKEAL